MLRSKIVLWLAVLFFIFITLGCAGNSSPKTSTSDAVVIYDAANPTMSFGALELKNFLAGTAGLNFVEGKNFSKGWKFEFKLDSSMQPYSFAVSCSKSDKGVTSVTLSGYDSACTLHALYTFLEQAGFRFEATGPVTPQKIDLSKLIGFNQTINPAVKKRGIRFHMNFPQDISSYTIEEAKEYIRNLARMRMNFMTFHSYPGRLHNGEYGGKLKYAGGTYDELMQIPDDPVIKNAVRNKKFYRIPELEQYEDMPTERAKLFKKWMLEVFEECKKMGFGLQFSFEPRIESMKNTMDMCMDIVESYPVIDVLEMITEENGGGGPKDPNGMRKVMEEYFDLKAYDDPILAPMLKDPNQSMVKMFQEIGHNLKAIEKFKKDYSQSKGLKFVIGVYCIPNYYTQAATRLMTLYVPDYIQTAQMPQYGSRWVAKRIMAMNITPQEWERKIIYGWYEFDGMFFLQEMDVYGVRDLVKAVLEQSKSSQFNQIAFNIWTTAENKTTLRYGALATVYGPIAPEEFFQQYASQMKISDVDTYLAAMKKLDAANERGRDTWNIGFGWGWMWVGWWNSTLTGWNYDILKEVQSKYEDILNDLSKLSADTDDGKKYLELLKNRVECSIYHYQAVTRLYDLLPIIVKPDREPVDPKTLTDEQRQKVLEICKESTYYVNKYLGTKAKIMPDRGSEGSLMSYYYCLPQLLFKLRAEYGGDKDAKQMPIQETDSWPKPAKWD